jgi:hypothetical protein
MTERKASAKGEVDFLRGRKKKAEADSLRE